MARQAANGVAVNRQALAPHNSYGEADFVMRGFYIDQPFECMGCGKAEVWTAEQQKWWYEVAKGYAFSTARCCRACRTGRGSVVLRHAACIWKVSPGSGNAKNGEGASYMECADWGPQPAGRGGASGHAMLPL